jgi:RNA polymerase sigma-70 factor, ECF subfamily
MEGAVSAARLADTVAPPSPNAPPLDFRAVYRDEFKFVWRGVQRLGARDAEVEDRVQDVFAVVVRRLHTFDRSRSLRLWLYGIIYRVMLDHHRKRSNHEEPVGTLPQQLSDDSPAVTAERTQGLSIAREIINSLDLDRRVVLVMADLEEMPVPEIAEVLEIPLNTAYSRLRLARRDFEAAARLRVGAQP